jgi:hypothetical protein
MSQKRPADDSLNEDDAKVPESGTGKASQSSSGRKRSDGSTGTGSKRSNSSIVPSANSCHGGGLQILSDTSSLLSHPLCLPLLYYLNEEVIEIDDHQQIEQLPLYRPPIDSLDYDTIFITAWTDCERELEAGKPIKEAKLTKKIKLIINNTQNTRSFAAESQYTVTGSNNSGNTDILLRKITDSKSTICPVVIMEFGMGHQQFYKKLDQLNHYVKMVGFDEHILAAVITIGNMSNDDNNNNNELSSTNMNIGLFFCCKRHDSSIRKTLIWKASSGNGVDACSKHFGKLLKATENYIHWTKQSSSASYQYFSSNCFKIDNQVRDCRVIHHASMR